MKFIDVLIQKQIRKYLNTLKTSNDSDELKIKFQWKGVNIELSGEDLKDIGSNLMGVFKKDGGKNNGKI